MGLRAQRGTVTVEMVIVFPTFLFLCFLVIELSMMWTDRHILNLAAYEAARTLAIQGIEGDSCGDAAAMKKAERAAVFKVAMVAPSPAYFFHGLLSSNQFTGALDQAEGALDSALGTTRIGAAIKRQMLGIPAAYALTSITCREDADGFIEIDARYLRAPKMPFVGGALWATFVLHRINESGIGSFLKFDLDQYYFGAKAKSPLLNEFKNKYETVKDGIKDAVDGAAGLGVELTGLADLVSSLPGGAQLGQVFSQAGGKVTSASAAVSAQIDATTAPVDAAIGTIEKSLNDHTKVLTAMIHKVPTSLRLIPMHAKVRLKKTFEDRRGDAEWDNGQAFLVAPFTAGNPESWSGDSIALWHAFAKALSNPSEAIGGGP